MALLAALALVGTVLAQTSTTFTVKRDDAELVVTNRGLAADGARTIGNNRNCSEGERMTIVYAPAPGTVETRVEDATLTSRLAIITTPDGAEAEAGEETLELSGDGVTFSRPGCIDERSAAGTPSVRLVQGKTRVTGTSFFLDREADTGEMRGPIALERDAGEGEEPLRATADAMEFAVGAQRATLTGNVSVVSEDRTTTGERLELDEEAGTAILTGNPARSVKGNDTLSGTRLLYYLDSNDVVVLGNVSGELDVDLQ
ncbi:MAG TPA: LptA/OstA family protein [Trueperaceae bacterium]|nr:LptA/OstA family protein [Trueperaceae bacterium]